MQMLQAVLGNQITEHQVDGFVCALIRGLINYLKYVGGSL